eukprot:GGOE01020244.1.p1 GENE.GGOE01020244.1~~GGOE01020244.1.p1  ORF type:complete len:389 (+),score=95.81 GGOE01020244.1:564-1730(+)
MAHPGVPRYIDSFDVPTDGDVQYCLVQRLASGETLAQLVAEGWRPTEAQVYNVGLQLFDILEYLGSLRPPVVHRDVKPENVVVDIANPSALKVSLVDFGAVLDTAKFGTFQSTVVGTYGYMAPEQYRGQASPRSDIFGAGATLLFLLSGQTPSQFPQARMRIQFRARVPLPRPLSSVLERMLEPVEEDRFATATEALEALQAARAGLLLPSQTPLGRPRPEGTAISLRRCHDLLEVSAPCGTMDGDLVGTAAFTVVWTSIVAMWTRSAILAGAPVSFLAASLPFWFTAISLLRQTFHLASRPPTTIDISIGREEFTVTNKVGQIVVGEHRGSTRCLEVVDGILPTGSSGRTVLLKEGLNEFRLGKDLSEIELQWVAEEVRKFMNQAQK